MLGKIGQKGKDEKLENFVKFLFSQAKKRDKPLWSASHI
jgi:hypothetical protein